MSFNAPKFSKDIIRAVRASEPIEICGLTLYPITMRDYDEFILCKDALAIQHSSLPAQYLAMDFVSALFALTLDEAKKAAEGKQPMSENTAAFQRVLRLLYLALRIPDGEENDISKDIAYIEQDDNIIIDHITIHQNGENITLTPAVFSSRIRPVLAYQNGIELPDERTNPDLIKEFKKYHNKSESDVHLKANADDLIASVAYLSHISEAEIIDWTVRQFEARVRAIERDKRYDQYGQAEMSGFVSFKNGNPAPSWCYDVEVDLPGSSSLSEVGKTLDGAGVKQK